MARGRSSLDEPLHRGAHSVARHAPRKNRTQAPAGQWEPEGVSILVAALQGLEALDLDGRGGATGAAPEIFKNNISVPTMVALARARRHLDSVGAGDVTLILSEMSLSDLTTWKRNVAELTGDPLCRGDRCPARRAPARSD